MADNKKRKVITKAEKAPVQVKRAKIPTAEEARAKSDLANEQKDAVMCKMAKTQVDEFVAFAEENLKKEIERGAYKLSWIGGRMTAWQHSDAKDLEERRNKYLHELERHMKAHFEDLDYECQAKWGEIWRSDQPTLTVSWKQD